MAAVVEIDIAEGSVGASSAKGIFAGAVCVAGVFDGVHLGHRFLIDSACALACDEGCPVVIITFDIDPDAFFAKGPMKKIMTDKVRITTLAEFDVEAVAVLRFNKELAAMQPEAFLDALFNQGLPRAIFVGENFRFGKGTNGDIYSLRSWASRFADSAPEMFALDLKLIDGKPVSSTRIRGLLSSGHMQEALELLGHPYIISGTVVHGRGQGSVFGVSTADLRIAEECMAAADGVYAAYATIEGEAGLSRYLAAVSVGIPPTFEDTAKANVEAHLLDFSGDIYGKEIRLDMRSYLRKMRKFDSTEELVSAINSDIEAVRTLLS